MATSRGCLVGQAFEPKEKPSWVLRFSIHGSPVGAAGPQRLDKQHRGHRIGEAQFLTPASVVIDQPVGTSATGRSNRGDRIARGLVGNLLPPRPNGLLDVATTAQKRAINVEEN